MIVLGDWEGLPALRVNTSKACPRCATLCDVCKGEKKKLCESCGGRTWIPGPFLPCPGPGCVRDSGGFATGKIKDGCATCRGAGHVPEELKCEMCEGKGKQTCRRCVGTGKYSTGRVNGSVDWDTAPKCKACAGSTYRGKWMRQEVKKFRNAILGRFDVLGPITQFAIRDPRTLGTRMFDVSADAAGDFLVLLAPRNPRHQPQGAYLVGGVVRETMMRQAVGA